MKVFYILVSLLIISGCSTVEVRKEVKVIQTKEIVLSEIDEQYLKECKIIPPAKPSELLKMGSDEREDHLTRILIKQYGEVAVCNIDKARLRSLITRQKEVIVKHNQDEVERVEKLKSQLENQR